MAMYDTLKSIKRFRAAASGAFAVIGLGVAVFAVGLGAGLGLGLGAPQPAFAQQNDDEAPAHAHDPTNIWAIARGGQLYDNWAAVLEQEAPEQTHPAYPAAGKKKGKST